VVSSKLFFEEAFSLPLVDGK